MNYVRMPIEIESPEQIGYENIQFNLTESSITDVKLADLKFDLDDLVVAYGDHLGHRKLRQLIAEDAGVDVDDVLLTVGAAMALFIVSTSLLKKDDRILVVRPNYATNIETPRAIGVQIDFLQLEFENRFCLTSSMIEKQIKSNETKLISITVPNNPTGAMISREELDQIIELAAKHQTTLIVDETYRDMTFENRLAVAASLGEHVVSVSSLSKTYGLPGIRIGWLICRNKTLMKKFLAAKEQIVICGSILDEEIAYRFYLTREERLKTILDEIHQRFQIVQQWIDESNEFFEWIEPAGGVVCFPRLKIDVDLDEFYRVLNEQMKTFVGPGHWFEMDRKYMRIGYGWPTTREELRQGLKNITTAVKICLKKDFIEKKID